MGVGVAGELGVDGQPDVLAVGAGQLDRELHPLGGAGDGGHVGVVLLGGQNFLQDGPQLDLAQDAAGLDARQHLLQPAHVGRQRLHLAQALVDLFQLVADGLEALAHPLLQGVLELLVHRAADLVQLFGVLSPDGVHPLGQGAAHLLQPLGVGQLHGAQAALQGLFHGLEAALKVFLLGGLAAGQLHAHPVHRVFDAPDGGVVLFAQSVLAGLQHPLKGIGLLVQLFGHPVLQVPGLVLGGPETAEQQHDHHGKDRKR